MTTYFSKAYTCFVCGQSSEHSIIGSTYDLGSPDLDLRAPPARRFTLPQAIPAMECAHLLQLSRCSPVLERRRSYREQCGI
jgi:hypothetical protein